MTSAVLTPRQAANYLQSVLQQDPRIAVVGIAGPGDPLATPQQTLETLRLVRAEPSRTDPLRGLQRPERGALRGRIGRAGSEPRHADRQRRRCPRSAPTSTLGSATRNGCTAARPAPHCCGIARRKPSAALKQRGITVKINTIIIPGVNEEHVPEVARRVAELGADIANCVPLYPVAGTALGAVEPPSPERVAAIRAEVARWLPIMEHCTRCRADAVGLLGEAMPPRVELALLRAAQPDDRSAMRGRGDDGRHAGQSTPRRGRATGRLRPRAGRLQADRDPPHAAARRRPRALDGAGQDAPRLPRLAGGQRRRGAAIRSGRAGDQGDLHGGIDRGRARRRVSRRRDPLPMRKEHRCGSGCAGNGQGCM